MVKLPDPYAMGESPRPARRPRASIDASAIAEGAERAGRSIARGGAALAEATGAGGEAIARSLAREAELGRAVAEGGAAQARVLRSLGEAEGTAVARAGRTRGRAVEESGATLGGAEVREGRRLATSIEEVGTAAGRGIRQASEAEGGAIQRGGEAISRAIERGAEMERRAAAQLGEGMARFAKGAQDYVDAEFRLDLARARANFITEKTILDGTFDRDIDYATLRERYEKEIGAIRERSAALIRSPRLREQFMLESQDNVARGLVRAERHAFKLETIDKRAELATRLENLRQSALIRKEDDRGETIAAGGALIDESQAAGYYTPTEAQDRKREWVESYSAAWTESRPPEQRLNLLNQAEEGKATGTPVDFLKPSQVLDLHRRATTKLLQERLRAESEAALARRAVLDKVNDDLRSMANTGQGVPGLEPETVERVLGRARFLEWQAGREDAHAIWVNTHDLYSLSEQQIDARLESLRPAAGAENGSRLQRIHDEVAKQVEQLRRLRREDPALSVGNDPMVQGAATAVDPQQPATFRPLATARLAAQERAGIPEKLRLPITKDEAVRLTEPLRRALPGQERDVLTNIGPSSRRCSATRPTGRSNMRCIRRRAKPQRPAPPRRCCASPAWASDREGSDRNTIAKRRRRRRRQPARSRANLTEPTPGRLSRRPFFFEATMAQVDRRSGVVDDLGIKRPVRCASTLNVTLSGLQTIDGIALLDGDRVLLTGQSTASQNGVWVASAGNWTRPKDFNGTLDCVRGTLVFVNAGSSNSQSLWQVSTLDPITIDTTPLAFVELVVATGNSTRSNTRLAKTSTYTVANADKGVTLALGGGAFFTVTLNAASAYDANFAITIVNEDSGRGKRISPNGLTSFILWPKQTVVIFNQNNAWQTDPPAPTRWIIPGAVTFLVHPTLGSDTNDGLGTGAGAFLTIQKAVDVAQHDVDCNGSGVVIQLADGTYTAGALITSPIIGTTTISITGNAVTPANVIVDVGPGETCFDVQDYAGLSLSNMRLIGGSLCVRSRQYAIVDLAGIEFGAATGTHIAAVDNSLISTSGALAIVGDAAVHVTAQANSIVNYNGTVTIASARAFTVFASASDHGVINGAATFTGGGVAGTTGIRFISTDSHIEQAITLPGNVAGTATWKADADGAAATPFWTWDSDTDTGIYRIGANNIGVAAGGTKALDISAAGVDMLGTNTNDNAAAGFVGEYIESAVGGGSAVPLTSGVTANVTSISLTAGDWDVFGNVAFTFAATTNVISGSGGASTTSATLPTGVQGKFNIHITPNAGNTVTGNPSGAFNVRLSLNATTTVFLVANAAFTVSTASAFGFIAARRAR